MFRISGAGGLSDFVLIAPTLAHHDHDAYRHTPRPLLVIASEDDFACDARRLLGWYDRLPAPKYLVQQKLDNHFFRGHEDWLTSLVCRFLLEQR